MLRRVSIPHQSELHQTWTFERTFYRLSYCAAARNLFPFLLDVSMDTIWEDVLVLENHQRKPKSAKKSASSERPKGRQEASPKTPTPKKLGSSATDAQSPPIGSCSGPQPTPNFFGQRGKMIFPSAYQHQLASKAYQV